MRASNATVEEITSWIRTLEELRLKPIWSPAEIAEIDDYLRSAFEAKRMARPQQERRGLNAKPKSATTRAQKGAA
jgi:hypothetical protein